MNWPYLHTLVNHFPIVLMVVGSAVLALALIMKNRGVWLYALATLTLAGLSIYPAFYSGDEASDAVRHTWYIVRDMVKEHDASANYALASLLALGVVSGYMWWRMLRREVTALPPVRFRVVVTVLTAVTLAIVVRTAYLGGRIVHESPKLEQPPAGVAPTGN